MITLKSLYTIFNQHPEGRWAMEAQNAYLLHEFIKTYPIKRVLDLGTGIGVSAAVVALALKEKGETDYHIDSLEQFDKCVKLANEVIPEELKEHLTIHKSEAKIWQTDKIPHQSFSIFETIPESPEGGWDMVINDGPGGFLEGEHYIDLPNGTITKMLQEGKIKTGAFIAWDGRQYMLKMLERYYGDNFWLKRPSQQGDDFNVLERKDNEILFRDYLLEGMRKQNYFQKDEKENLLAVHGETPSSAPESVN